MPMNSKQLAAARNLTPDNIRQLKAQEMLAPELDALCVDDTWLNACVAAIQEAPDWLRRQAEDGAQLPAFIAEHQRSQAGAVFLAQAAAAAAAEAWLRDADACIQLARRAAQRWSAIEGLTYDAPATPVRPLATLPDSLQAERVLHDVRAWAPIEDMVLLAARAGRSAEPASRAAPAVKTVVPVKTWGCTPAGTGPLTLILETVPDRQPGLWRAPSAGLTVVDAAFLAATQDAWTWAVTSGGLNPHTSVRWRLLDVNGTRVPQVTGNSAGLAFAVALHQAGVSWRRLRALHTATSYLGSVTVEGTVAMPSPGVTPQTSRHVRYVIAPTKQLSDQAKPAGKLKLRPAADASQAIALGRRPVKIRNRLLLAAACSLTIIAGAASFAAIRSGQSDISSSASAAAHERQAQALDLANQVTGLLSSDPSQAIVAAAAAYHLDPANPTVQNAVIAAAGSDPRTRHYVSPAGPVAELSLSGDGSLVAALLASGRIEVWSIAAKTPRLLPVPQPPGSISAIGFAGGGSSLVTAGSRVTMLDPMHGTSRQLDGGNRGSENITALSVSPSSLDFVTSSPAGIRLWNGATGSVRLLSATPATVISLAPDARNILAGGPSGTLRLISAAGGQVTAQLPSAVTSDLLAPSGNAYALTAAGRLYVLNSRLRQVHASTAFPAGSTLTLRPAATARMLTEGDVVAAPRAAEVVVTASNAALMLPDDPAQLTVDSGTQSSVNQTGIPIRGLGGAILASDGSGTTTATIVANGQIRISTFDLTGNPNLRVLDLASAAVVAKSTIAVASGLTFVRAFVALMNPSDGSIFTVKAFTHAPNLIYVRPAISTHYIADTGNPASSIDLWRINGRHLVTLASNLQTPFPSVRGFTFDETAGLLFDGGANDIQVRDLQRPSRVVSETGVKGTVNCLSVDPAHRVVYACTTGGIIALTYGPTGVLGSPVTVDPAIAVGVAIGPGGKDLVIGASGVTYLPEAFGAHGNDAIDLAAGEPTMFGAAVTPTAVVTSGQNADIQLYSASGADLDTFQLGSLEQAVTVLWPDGDGLISGSTFDGSLFTLPPTRPADAVTYGCALLADPGAEWHADYGGDLTVARLLPPNGGC
jgi:WD40 repeat protein